MNTPHYAPQPQYPQYPQPPQAGPTIWGVPLEYGERVLYYRRHTGSGERIFMIVMGVVLLPVLFGILLLYWGIFYEQTHERVQVITDRRILGISGTRVLKTAFSLREIERIVRVTGKKNQYVVHGPGIKLMIFNFSDHNFAVLEPVIRQLQNPHALPNVQFEP